MQPSPVLTLRGPDDIINCIKCLDGNIITGSISGKLNLWNLNTKRLALSTQSHHQSILSLAQINNNCSNSLLSSSRDGDVKVWDIENLCNPSLSTFVTGAFHFCNISTDQDGLDKYCLITPSNNLSEVITWDLRASTKSLSFNIPDSCGMTTHLLYYSTSLVGSTVFVGSEDGSVSAFDLRNTSYPITSLKAHEDQPVLSMDFSTRRGLLLSGTADNYLTLSTVSTGSSSEKYSALAHSKFQLPVAGTSCVQFRCDSRIAVSSHWDGSVRVFGISKTHPLKPLALLRHHREPVTGIDFESTQSSKYYGFFYTASKDGSISQWDLYSDKVS